MRTRCVATTTTLRSGSDVDVFPKLSKKIIVELTHFSRTKKNTKQPRLVNQQYVGGPFNCLLQGYKLRTNPKNCRFTLYLRPFLKQ